MCDVRRIQSRLAVTGNARRRDLPCRPISSAALDCSPAIHPPRPALVSHLDSHRLTASGNVHKSFLRTFTSSHFAAIRYRVAVLFDGRDVARLWSIGLALVFASAAHAQQVRSVRRTAARLEGRWEGDGLTIHREAPDRMTMWVRVSEVGRARAKRRFDIVVRTDREAAAISG